MIIKLQEQRFTNKNKIWYRGRDKIDTGYQKWRCLFLTTNLGYAYGYAINSPEGFVEERVLQNTPLNIFNTQSTYEFKFIEKHFPQYAGFLKKGDWYEILGMETRSDFLNVLKDLKYDGFINFENDGEAVSIGIFNPENTKVVGTLTLDEVRATNEFRRSYLQEKRLLSNTIRFQLLEKKLKISFNHKLKIIKPVEIKRTFNYLKSFKLHNNPKVILSFGKDCCTNYLL